MFDQFLTWYSDAEPDSYIVRWLRRYPLYFIVIILANLFAVFCLAPWYGFNKYILKRDVKDSLQRWGFALTQLVIYPPSM